MAPTNMQSLAHVWGCEVHEHFALFWWWDKEGHTQLLGECTLDALVLDESENKTLDLARINSELQQTRNAVLKAGHTRSAAGIFCGWTQFATMSSTWPAIHSVFKRMLTKPVSRGAERKLRRMKMQTFA